MKQDIADLIMARGATLVRSTNQDISLTGLETDSGETYIFFYADEYAETAIVCATFFAENPCLDFNYIHLDFLSERIRQETGTRPTFSLAVS